MSPHHAEPVAHAAPRVAFVTLGCPKNEVDTDRMKAALATSGFIHADDLADADIVVVNTCGFIRAAVEEGIETVLELADWRDERPGRKLVVAGCMVSRYAEELSSELSEADAFVSLAEEPRLAGVLRELWPSSDAPASDTALAPGNAGDADHDAGILPVVLRTPASGPSAYLQISDGCFRSCAYCTIPSIRGPYRSRPLAEIEEEARYLVATGAREIILVGQDTSSWGRDLEGEGTLADVVATLAHIDGLRWLRVMYVQPDGVTEELLRAMADNPTVCRYLDIPLQHASAPVLRRMRRSGSADEFLAMLARIRDIMPDVVVRTSLIAGFPGETRADVDTLVRFLGDARLDYVGVFTYSPEPGTPGASMSGLPDARTRVRRSQRLRDAADAISLELTSARVGTVLEVLSEGLDEEGTPVGRWRGQAPEIDGAVLLDRAVPVGEVVRVRVVDALGYDLEGEVL